MNENKKNIELNEEQLKAISGGSRTYEEKVKMLCPVCNCERTFVENDWRDGRTCSECGHEIKYEDRP